MEGRPVGPHPSGYFAEDRMPLGAHRPPPDVDPVAATYLIILVAVGTFLLPAVFSVWAGIMPFVNALRPL